MTRRRIAWVLGLGLSAAAACRPAVRPASVPARVAPAAGPAVQVCWAESARIMGFTASALVVRHSKGDLLIDAGNSTALRQEIQPYDRPTRRWLRLLPGSLTPKRPLSEVLAQMDVDPQGLRWALPTHAHLDHLGGLLDLPPTRVLFAEPEARLVQRGQTEVLFEVMPAHAKALAPRVETLIFQDAPYEIFDRHADLFGDGSVVVVPLHGHTPGSVGVFVRRADGRRIFHVGDAINSRTQLRRSRGKTPAMRRTDTDRAAAEHNVARLHAFAEQADDIDILPAHERAAWVDLLGEPGASCSVGPVQASR